MPTLVVGERHVVGFDAERLAAIVQARSDRPGTPASAAAVTGGVAALSGAEPAGARPPGNSLEVDQGQRVITSGDTLVDDLQNLLGRIDAELDYNAAKGATPFRQGMHDGLRFAQDAVADLLSRHGHAAAVEPRDWDF